MRGAFHAGGARTGLVVLVHGYDGSVEQMAPLAGVARERLPDADIFVPKLPYGGRSGRICMRRPERIAADLMLQIDGLVEERRREGGYNEIHVVGYSFGAVLARRLVVLAHGEQAGRDGVVGAPFEPELADFRRPRRWAHAIKRLVLLAGMNRGWAVSSAMDWLTSVRWSVSQLMAETVLQGRPTIMAIRKGAPFLVQTRLQWLALMDAAWGPRPKLLSVQLLGTIDDWVSPDDNVDYSVDLTSSGATASYFYIEVPASGHISIRDMGRGDGSDTPEQRVRRERFVLALVADAAELGRRSIQRGDMQDVLPPEPDTSVTDLVFVVHGIRDKGFWTQKLARAIKLASEENAARALARDAAPLRKFASWTESYGYFAMLPFVFRITRQRKVEWLMDCYVEARARYPRAVFHYVGHSNGTYLAAQALRDYPSARFDRVVFLGSVVRRDYDWHSLVAAGRVRLVLNYVATADWVVAVFPNGLQPLRWIDLGSAGHDGFDQAAAGGPVHEVRYVVGGHGAGLEEPHWGDVARFVVRGEPPPPRYPPFSKDQSSRWRSVGQHATALVASVATILLGIGVFLAWHVLHGDPTVEATVARVAAFALYCFLAYLVATRV